MLTFTTNPCSSPADNDDHHYPKTFHHNELVGLRDAVMTMTFFTKAPNTDGRMQLYKLIRYKD